MATAALPGGEKTGSPGDLKTLHERYTECASSLIRSCQDIIHIPGVVKLERKCAAELKYLRSLSNRRGGFNITHLRSSNLGHYAGIIHAVQNLPDVTHVLQAFSCPGRPDALHIDVIACRGHTWVKVIARKAQAVHLTWAGQGQFGEKDITLQADDYTVCSEQHTVNFQVPKVAFSFYNGVTGDVANVLRDKGIAVIGEIVPVDAHIVKQLSNLEFQDSESDSESDDSDASIQYEPLVDDCQENIWNIDEENEKGVSENQENVGSIGDRSNSHDIEALCTTIKADVESTGDCASNTSEENKDEVGVRIDRIGPGEKPEIEKPVLEFNCDCYICTDWKIKRQSCRDIPIKLDSSQDKSRSDFMESKIVLSEQYSGLICPLNELSSNRDENKKPGRFPSLPLDDSLISSNDSNCPQRATATKISCKIEAGKIHEGNTCNPDTHSSQGNLTAAKKALDNKTADSIAITSQTNLLAENELQKKTDCEGLVSGTSKWDFGSACVIDFIHNELLVHPNVDYSFIQKLGSSNEMNSIYNINKVNLDVTTLISLVSTVSHGRCSFLFQEKVLSEQAAEERRDPVLPKLLRFLEGKSLYACQTAVESFNSITGLLGGPYEKARTQDLLSVITVVPDKSSFRAAALPNTGKLKDRSKVIFGTGDSLGAVTTTANCGFIRAAERQGVTFPAFIHDARALTEMKEATAQLLS